MRGCIGPVLERLYHLVAAGTGRHTRDGHERTPTFADLSSKSRSFVKHPWLLEARQLNLQHPVAMARGCAFQDWMACPETGVGVMDGVHTEGNFGSCGRAAASQRLVYHESSLSRDLQLG